MLFPGVPSNLLEASNLQHVIYPQPTPQQQVQVAPPQQDSSLDAGYNQDKQNQSNPHSNDPSKGQQIDVFA